eukprot:TRINITY_DN4289_c0_g1_i3.p1 TRINITY_DN4289_c0_g1~~TRINITY_DN4289_c0_g1_i3.p1  ORF type:complete len:470 (-),score=99.66 TRINITY_DN4289_c0_g1_i3:207-1616(-)
MGQKVSVEKRILADSLSPVDFPTMGLREVREKTLLQHRSVFVHIPDSSPTWVSPAAISQNAFYFELLQPSHTPLQAVPHAVAFAGDSKRKRDRIDDDSRHIRSANLRNSNLTTTQQQIAAEVSNLGSVYVKPDTKVSAVAWHKYRSILAVAYSNSSISIYDTTPSAFKSAISRFAEEHQAEVAAFDLVEHPSKYVKHSQLSHQFQEHIYKMEWQPMAGRNLAVATNAGVFLWKVPFEVGADSETGASNGYLNTKAATVSILRVNDQQPVTAIAWSPCGKYLVASSIVDDRIVVWDTTTEMSSVICHIKQATVVSWSPDGQYLFVGSNSSGQHIFETYSWNKISLDMDYNIGTKCQDAVWSHSSDILLVAMGDHMIYVFQNEFLMTPKGLKFSCVVSYDLTATKMSFTNSTPDPVEVKGSIGGKIRRLAWDAHSRRLAVSFHDCGRAAPDGSELVLIFNTWLKTRKIQLS